MATASCKSPPVFNKSKCYTDWVRLVKLWTKFTGLGETQQGPALVMTLEDKDLEAALELDDAKVASKDGVLAIIEKLDMLHKKDELQEKFNDLENFESFK